MSETLTPRQREILHVIEKSMQERGYPPSVREIGEAVGLNSPSTVHNHLASLQKMGFLRRDPTKPRAIEVRFDTNSEVAMERRPARHVPLVGDVAAGTDVLAQENVEDLIPLPTDFTGEGELFMLRVRGESMIEAGILDGDFALIRRTDVARDGEIVVDSDDILTLQAIPRRMVVIGGGVVGGVVGVYSAPDARTSRPSRASFVRRQ